MLKKITALAFFLLASTQVVAVENGVVAFPVGVHSVLNGFTTQPGENRIYNYLAFASANRLNDSNGNRVPVKFKAEIAVEALRIDRGWETRLADFTLSSGIVATMLNTSVTIGDRESNKFGLGNFTVKPVIFGLVNDTGTLHQSFSLFDLVIPTGSYDEDRLANPGFHYYSWQPSYAYTWFPTANIEISGTLSAALNAENKDTNYKSGTTVHYEQMIGYSITPTIQIALQGFYYDQVSNDELNGRTFQDGNRGRAAALGPQIRYSPKPGVAVALKYQKDFIAENQSEGGKVWLQFSLPF